MDAAINIAPNALRIAATTRAAVIPVLSIIKPPSIFPSVPPSPRVQEPSSACPRLLSEGLRCLQMKYTEPGVNMANAPICINDTT